NITYELTATGGDQIALMYLTISGNFSNNLSEKWIHLADDFDSVNKTLSGSTTYGEMTDALVSLGYDRQQVLDESIKYYAVVGGPNGFCQSNNTWSGYEGVGTGETCDTYNPLCTGTIKLESTIEQPDPVTCNESCTSDTECKLTNDEYICDVTSNKCRLDANKTSTTCELAENNNDSNDSNSSDDSSSTVACNDICVTNADCSDTDHTCVTTADGSNRCRLTAYTSSESCVIESSGGTTTDTSQPSLPAELPESGPEDWLNWLKAGLVTMGIGTALFLLL
ncbi:hypothetical protein HOC96_05075, partial [archaeon]|nr:hypothetical protein [archaeon]